MRPRRGAPLWLAGPTRFAGLSRVPARIALALFALLLVACLAALSAPDTQAESAGTDTAAAAQTELMLYQTVVASVRSGAPYYLAAAEAQRAAHHPFTPIFAMRLPTLAVLQAALPPLLVTVMLLVLCILTILAWVLRVRPAMTGLVPLGVAGAMLIVGLYGNLDPALVVIHEIWAGPLIAVSLARRRPGQWIPAVALGLSAMLIRETALVYVVIMAVFAWREGQRREMLGWLAAILVFALVVAAHLHAVALVTGPLDRVAQGWSDAEGPGGYLRLAATASGLALLPQWLAALLVGTALFGWLAWRNAIAPRVLALFVAYAAIIAVSAAATAVFAIFLTLPVLLVGLVFAVDALRDLAVAAADTRRITVTRVIR